MDNPRIIGDWIGDQEAGDLEALCGGIFHGSFCDCCQVYFRWGNAQTFLEVLFLSTVFGLVPSHPSENKVLYMKYQAKLYHNYNGWVDHLISFHMRYFPYFCGISFSRYEYFGMEGAKSRNLGYSATRGNFCHLTRPTHTPRLTQPATLNM